MEQKKPYQYLCTLKLSEMLQTEDTPVQGPEAPLPLSGHDPAEAFLTPSLFFHWF